MDSCGDWYRDDDGDQSIQLINQSINQFTFMWQLEGWIA